MIPVRRTGEPRSLTRHGARWLNQLRTVMSDSSATAKQIDRARSQYNKRDVKTALKEMFKGKCAYCESKVTHVAPGDIEHFRPKSDPRYVDLTFEWTNLLLSCPICNGPRHKGTHFPLDAHGNPLLIDPTDGVTDPYRHLRFDWNAGTQEAFVYGVDARGRMVEDTFDLNGMRGRLDLVRHRRERVKYLAFLCERARRHDLMSHSLLLEACSGEGEYAAFARTLAATL